MHRTKEQAKKKGQQKFYTHNGYGNYYVIENHIELVKNIEK